MANRYGYEIRRKLFAEGVVEADTEEDAQNEVDGMAANDDVDWLTDTDDIEVFEMENDDAE